MRKHQLLLAALVFSIAATAQQPTMRKPLDSSYYYTAEMSRMMRQAQDSVRNSQTYKDLQKKYELAVSKSDGYSSFNMFTEVVSADFDKFNSDMAAAGFPAIEGPVMRFGIGTTAKNNRFVFDFAFFSLGVGKKTKKADEKVRAFVSNGIICDFGYDLVKSQRVNIYPYGGFSMRVASIYYTKPVTGNSSPANITNLVLNNQSVSADYTRVGLQAGVGFDFVVTKKNRDERYSMSSDMMFFVKAGTSQMIGKERYNTEAGKFTPGIKYGTWAVMMGIKFFGRQ